jgi:hypothetical protein
MNPTQEQERRRQAEQTIRNEQRQNIAAVQFTVVDDYTTFYAEYAFVENDIVVHFFLPTEALVARTGQQPDSSAIRDQWARHFVENDTVLHRYWFEIFPASLERVATSVFLAGPPRLVAAYTEEVASWWFKAAKFCILKPEELIKTLFVKLDQDLDAAGAASMVAPNRT